MSKKLRIIFLGTPEFAVNSLKILVENGENVVAVVTAPDKPQGRGMKLVPSPVKVYAASVGIPVLQPEKLKDPKFLEELRSFNADIQVVVAFRMLPELVWNMPPLGTFNLHASLLPQYRGAAPINWALINGETQTGLTIFFLKHEIDTGDIYLQEQVEIFPEDDYASLYERMSRLGAALVLQTIRDISRGPIQLRPQNHTSACKPAPKLTKEMGLIDWQKSCIDIHNLVRGYPGAYTFINGNYTRIWKSQPLPNLALNETFETDGKHFLHIACSDGVLSVLRLQPEGKRQMDIKEYLAGNKIISVGEEMHKPS